MNYRETMEYIEETKKYGSVLGLESICALCEQLGNPQNDLKFIHIAGTNGKGSTLAFLSAILQEAGYRVGRYSSPSVFSYEEKMQVDGKSISKQALSKVMTQAAKAAEQMVLEGRMHPTTFELETAAAFLYFREKKCDLVVLETGMGGNLDATNIITSVIISVLTSISMDHMGFLGNSLAEIAEKKAGIIKEGARVVSVRQPEEAMQVITDAASKKNCPLVIADEREVSNLHQEFPIQSFFYRSEKIKISLAGSYQIKNAILAFEVIQTLNNMGYEISKKQMKTGFLRTVWQGRLSVVCRKPLFVIDGAHNEEASRFLAKSVEDYFTNRKIIYIIGMLKDKEYEKVISVMAKYASDIITVTPPWPGRALSSYELAKTVQQYHSRVTAADSLEEAVEMSFLLAKEDSVILAFGSLSYLGDLKRLVEDKI